MTILAIDHGTNHIGIALSDPDNIVARPLDVYTHTSGKKDAARIVATAQTKEASLILLGTPTNSTGEKVRTSTRINRFASTLQNHTVIPVLLWDESGSTVRAHQILATYKQRKKPSHISIHSIAAAVILQDYLDAHAN
ncbi:MAG: Holliday junction resolvase RuvX [Anaerolineales bacterium]|nr:Holliday junction resolvase RuvX [Anaerolineales bacterium]